MRLKLHIAEEVRESKDSVILTLSGPFHINIHRIFSQENITMEDLVDPESHSSHNFWQAPKMSSENKLCKNPGMRRASWQDNASQEGSPAC